MGSTKALTKVLLEILVGLGHTAIELDNLMSALTTGYDTAYRHGGQPYVAELKRLGQKRVMRTTLNQLKYRRYITARKLGDRLIVTLTTKGRTATIAGRLKQAKPNRHGFYTIVIFDVPEQERMARRQLRLMLRQGGFIKLQQSVWMSRADTYDTIVEFIRQLKLQPWVNVYRATDFLHLPRQAK